ncbi:MAG: HAMP domain-containing protein [Candidatus Latescibacteria bacterium]|nr:HAMP domain-containing protein [Candidatus Latescibacterota bacterium]NIO57243.1 HAMP domain-containing protein [Candidatus Latescibacterota bacterium]
MAKEIEEKGAQLDSAQIETILRSYCSNFPSVMLLFRQQDGTVVADRPIPPNLSRRLDRVVSGKTSGRGRGAAPGAGPGRMMRVRATQPVMADGEKTGDVIALTLPARTTLFPPGTPRPTALFLPIAIVVAGIAGMILFRILLRRIRDLERLAMRVAEEDLDVRVPKPGPDEIGRLGSQLNRMTENLAAARRHVEEGERQRRQLLGDISHELATPSTSIRGYTETLLNPDIMLSEEKRKQYLNDVLDEAKRMDLLIQDLLDLTRLEAGAIQLFKEPLDWVQLCQNTMSRFQARFSQSGIHLRWVSSLGEAWVEADGRRLEQVSDNLLTNALRYVPSGGNVMLSLAEASDSQPRRFKLLIGDDGPGFPRQDLPYVFDRFYRGDTARAAPGSGLGLAIVREIIRLNGGDGRAENRSPSGAAITVDMPALEKPPAP